MKRKKNAGGLAKKERALVSARKRSGNNGRDGHSLYSADGHPLSELEQAIQRYVDLFEFAPIGYVSLDRVGHIEEINRAGAELLGSSRDRLIGAPFALCVARTDTQLFLHHLLRCRSSSGRVDTELHLRATKGTTRQVLLSSTPSFSDRKDGARFYQTAIVDLTERKRTEEALRESEERYRTLFDLVPMAIYTTDARGLIQEFNQRAAELWGRRPRMNDPKEKFCGSFKIFCPDGRPLPHKDCPMARVLRGEKVPLSDLEIVVEREDGARCNVAVSPTALRNERGRIIGAINCLYDITQRKEASDALRESQDLYRALVSQTDVGMARSDLKGRFAFVNPRFCEMLGYTKSELIGKSISEITHPEDAAESKRLFQRIVRQAEPYHIEKRYVRKDGSRFWVSVSASPMRDAKGKTQSAIAVILDISARKQAQNLLTNTNLILQRRIREATDELLAANAELKEGIERRKQLEGEILEIVEREQRRFGQELHDSLCQHLTATSLMARVLSEQIRSGRQVDPEELDKICDLISEGVTEARGIARDLHPVEMNPSGLVAALRTLAQRKPGHTQCIVDVDDDVHISDPVTSLHLFRIAREAVTNANKHARANEIIVHMHRSAKQIELSVTDDGVGLPQNYRGGPGLGLHMIEYRARSIGADFSINSIRPHGTRLLCRVPQK